MKQMLCRSTVVVLLSAMMMMPGTRGRAQCMAGGSSTVANTLNACGNGQIYEESWNLSWFTYLSSNPSVHLDSGSGTASGQGYCGYLYYKAVAAGCPNGPDACYLPVSYSETDNLPKISHYMTASGPSSATVEFMVQSYFYLPGWLCTNDPTKNMQGSSQESDNYYDFTGSC